MLKKTRLFSAVLAVSLLAGCGISGGAGDPQPEPSVRSGAICYVPLDDRPDNAERVEYLANSLGYTLLTPEEDWYKTRLDGQPLNENGTQSGNREALFDWVLQQESSGCDRYVLFLDQLLSGGLVNSRHMAASDPVFLSNGAIASEAQLLELLLTTLSADPNNQVWLLDTVMRLAPTMGYAGFQLEDYNALRAYGMEGRPVLSGNALTIPNIVRDYTLGGDGSPLSPESFSVTQETVAEYLAARERKLRLSAQVQQALTAPGYENFHLLIGIDDSSSEDSIQKNEIAYLRQGLRTDDAGAATDWLLSGVDDLAFKAVTKLYLTESGWGGATAHVSFYGGTELQPACDYDYQPLVDIVAEHLDFFNLRSLGVKREQADLQILVLTQPEIGSPEKQEKYTQELTEALLDNEEENLPTVLIDAGNGQYGTAFHDALVKDAHLGWLLSYSGFLDMAIVTGTALSHGVARLAWLQNGGGAGAEDLANNAFQKTLVESVVLDFCYKNVVRNDLMAYVRDQLGGDANNFYAPPIDLDAAQTRLADGMEQSAKAVLKNFSHSNLIVSLAQTAENGGLVGWGKVSLSDWSFPWSRAFEVRMQIDVNDLTKRHKKLLFFYT